MPKKQLLVTGDVAVDINIYKGTKNAPDISGDGTRIKHEGGGAHLLFRLIQKINNPSEISECETYFGFNETIFKDSSAFPGNQTSYAAWHQVKSKPAVLGVQKAWKILDKLGFGSDKPKATQSVGTSDFLSRHQNQEVKTPSILVIDDGANHFRNKPELWEYLLKDSSKTDHIVFKMSSPIAKGKLFNQLVKTSADKLVIISSIDEIRKEPVLISKGISWEQTALDLIYELTANKTLKHLLRARHLYITIQTEGVLYLETKNGMITRARLIFDPAIQEGEWDEYQGISGDVIGLMNCFTAGVVAELMTPDNPNYDYAATRGLSAQRQYKASGHTVENCSFPFDSVIKQIQKPTQLFASAFVPIPSNAVKFNPENSGINFKNANWTILEGNYLLEKAKTPLYDMGIRLAALGENELTNVPRLKVNKFLTYDRSEIESLRNLKNLIIDYLKNDKGDKPLSLAVFGAPGAGKSFAVKQLAKSHQIPFLEFNLSQFEDVNELTGAFHQVRDEVLKGESPIVFWDEFDSQSFLWLQYLLAPMQDGKFQEGQITHPIGKCIFIFAGGTSFSFETFGVPTPQYPDAGETDNEAKKQQYEINLKRFNEFKLKKGPDFKSRLTGYLNVLGPNQLEKLDPFGNVLLDEKGNPVKDADDIFFPIRRALFVRTIFGKKGNQKLDTDYGIVNALLKIKKYKHGSRSLEKILSHLKLKDKNTLKRAYLPSYRILSMLVDYETFIKFLDEHDDFTYQVFNVAPEIHNNWMRLGDKQGWKLEYHKPYHYLPSHLKEENIAAASRIQDILKIQDLQMVTKADAGFHEVVDFNQIINDPDILDELAIAEHEGWVTYRTTQNWHHASERNDDQKLHNCMVHWDELTDKQDKNGSVKGKEKGKKEKDKDRDAIKNYADILANAGFVIVKTDAHD
ncbi:MAG: AAA family ATPase [Desulfobacteraceae bacterium]|nr:AAA family ATPase [Desulfobacteraceae bacterium]